TPIDFGGCHNLGVLTPRQLQDQMARAAIYALPARYEPFGLSVLEAAASGCALVLGRIPSLLENYADVASFVDPDDHDELVHAIEALIADPIRRKVLGRHARTRAQQLTAAKMADAYEHLYRELSGVRPVRSIPCAS
ncbi:MAG TPA: glycosyltransferase family 4 protein, partial [Polyangiales bacterium]|nr:glycosyltransferase family 4 protein [Polyangiales bacterium]